MRVIRPALAFLACILPPLAVAACAANLGPGRVAPPPVAVVVCPPLKTYSPADQKALAVAVAALPPASPLVGALADYGALRQAVRACRAG